MKNIMNKLSDTRRSNDLARPINLDSLPNGYWELLYAEKEYRNN